MRPPGRLVPGPAPYPAPAPRQRLAASPPPLQRAKSGGRGEQGVPEVCSDMLGGNPQLGAEGRGTPALNETRGSLAGGGGCGRSPHFERGRSCCRGSQTGSSGESKHSRARFPEKCSLPLCDVMASRRDAPRTTRAWVSRGPGPASWPSPGGAHSGAALGAGSGWRKAASLLLALTGLQGSSGGGRAPR